MSARDERLYYEDSYLREFATIVADVKEMNGDTWIRLRESGFYPTSGGQPHDLGSITILGQQDEYMVTGVEVEDGKVWHRVSASLEVGQSVMGQIDWQRRFDFMQQHSGQHILSACFEQSLSANTSSFHMGDTYSSIDLDIGTLADDEVQRVMEQANDWIWRDVPICARFVSSDELSSIKLRKAPSVQEDIRIVTIDGLEDNACGGTHPSSTGQVGQILITKTERMRGGVRVTFVCGARALSTAKDAVDTVRTMATSLSVGNADLLDAMCALQNEVKEHKRKYEAMRDEYANLRARDFVRQGTRRIGNTHVLFAELPDLDEAQELKRMTASSAKWLTDAYPNEPHLVIYAGEMGGRTHITVDATDGVMVSAADLVKMVLPPLNGKGGGTAKAAQGSAPAPKCQVTAAIKAIFETYG